MDGPTTAGHGHTWQHSDQQTSGSTSYVARCRFRDFDGVTRSLERQGRRRQRHPAPCRTRYARESPARARLCGPTTRSSALPRFGWRSSIPARPASASLRRSAGRRGTV